MSGHFVQQHDTKVAAALQLEDAVVAVAEFIGVDVLGPTRSAVNDQAHDRHDHQREHQRRHDADSNVEPRPQRVGIVAAVCNNNNITNNPGAQSAEDNAIRVSDVAGRFVP